MKRVVVTDDDPSLQAVLVMILERAGYKVALIDGKIFARNIHIPIFTF